MVNVGAGGASSEKLLKGTFFSYSPACLQENWEYQNQDVIQRIGMMTIVSLVSLQHMEKWFLTPQGIVFLDFEIFRKEHSIRGLSRRLKTDEVDRYWL